MKYAVIPVVKDQETNRAIQALAQNVNTVAKRFLEIYTVTATINSAADTKVDHKLGRVPVGFSVVDSTADIRVWRTALSTETTLTLRSNVTSAVTLLIF